MTIDPMTGWPVPFNTPDTLETREYLCSKARHYLGQTDMPLWVLKARIFGRDDLPTELRLTSIDLQFALVERAARSAGAVAVLSLDTKHLWW